MHDPHKISALVSVYQNFFHWSRILWLLNFDLQYDFKTHDFPLSTFTQENTEGRLPNL